MHCADWWLRRGGFEQVVVAVQTCAEPVFAGERDRGIAQGVCRPGALWPQCAVEIDILMSSDPGDLALATHKS